MTLGELIGLEAKLPAGAARVAITGLAADSRAVKPGYLFAALPGVKTDGARFIADALQRGAAAILAPDGSAPATASVPVIEDGDPRRALALIAARFFGLQPKTSVAVTGTNGKTSVASFVRQIWTGEGFKAASLGTVGVVSPRGTEVLKHTTPDPIELHALLARLAKDGVTHLAMEASSHGLQQRRVDGISFAAGAFTNLTRDHLDYHASVEDYFAQKLRLFTELLSKGAGAVVDVDSDAGLQVADASKARGLELISVGRSGKTLRLVSAEIDGVGQILVVEHASGRDKERLPLGGGFQSVKGTRRRWPRHGDRRDRRYGSAVARNAARGAWPPGPRRNGERGRANLHRLRPHAGRPRQGARRLAALRREPAHRR